MAPEVPSRGSSADPGSPRGPPKVYDYVVVSSFKRRLQDAPRTRRHVLALSIRRPVPRGLGTADRERARAPPALGAPARREAALPSPPRPSSRAPRRQAFQAPGRPAPSGERARAAASSSAAPAAPSFGGLHAALPDRLPRCVGLGAPQARQRPCEDQPATWGSHPGTLGRSSPRDAARTSSRSSPSSTDGLRYLLGCCEGGRQLFRQARQLGLWSSRSPGYAGRGQGRH